MIARGVVGSVLVLVGGLVVSPLPASSEVRSVLGIVALSATTSGRMQGLTVVLLGLALLGASWLQLCRHTAHGTADVTTARIAAISWSLPLLFAPPLFSRDGWSYAAQGVLTHLGASPYVWTPNILQGPVREAVDPMWLDTPAPYGPVSLLWGGLATSFTHEPWLLVVAHRLSALIGLALLAWAVPRLAQWSSVNPALASALVLLSPLMIAHGVGGLHNDLLMVGIAAVALVVAAERGWMWGAALGGLAAAVKLPGGLVCIGIVLLSLPVAASLGARVRRYAAVAAIAVGVLAATGIPRGLGIGWVNALGVPGVVHTPLSVTTMLGRLVGDVTDVRSIGMVVAVGLMALLAFRTETGSRQAALGATCGALLALLVLSPTVHLWYLLWVIPFAACLRLTRLQSTTLIVVSVAAGLAAPLDSSLHGLYLVVLGGTAIALGLAAVLLLTARGRARVDAVAQSHQGSASGLIP